MNRLRVSWVPCHPFLLFTTLHIEVCKGNAQVKQTYALRNYLNINNF